jgi:preprotein translocase subunit SecG
MTTFVTVIHIVTCVLIMIVVLMQSGKGAEISATLGGSSNTVFGSSGGSNFFSKTTFVLAAVFMFTSVTLTILGTREKRSVFDSAPTTTSATLPKSGETVPATAPAAPVNSAPAATAPVDASKK